MTAHATLLYRPPMRLLAGAIVAVTVTACGVLGGGLSASERHACDKIELQIRDTNIRTAISAGSGAEQMLAYSSAAQYVDIYLGDLPAGSKTHRAAVRLRSAFAAAGQPPRVSGDVIPAEVDFRAACGLPLDP